MPENSGPNWPMRRVGSLHPQFVVVVEMEKGAERRVQRVGTLKLILDRSVGKSIWSI